MSMGSQSSMPETSEPETSEPTAKVNIISGINTMQEEIALLRESFFRLRDRINPVLIVGDTASAPTAPTENNRASDLTRLIYDQIVEISSLSHIVRETLNLVDL